MKKQSHLEKEVTIYEDFSKVENKNLLDVLHLIKEGEQKKYVEVLQKLIEEQNQDQYNVDKKKLKAFTVSATFGETRKEESLETYNKLIILDVDKVAITYLDTLIKKAKLAPYTLAVFKSPSGRGIKIIVAINTDIKHHKEAYEQVAEYYERALETEIDRSGKDITRLCFMSYDPELYIKENAEVFEVNIKKRKQEITPKETVTYNNTETDTDCYSVLEFTKNKATYVEGNRNNFIHLFACNCNRKGLSHEEVLAFALNEFDLPTKEIKKSVESAFKNNANEFAKFKSETKIVNTAKDANTAKHAEVEDTEGDEVSNTLTSEQKDEILLNMPYLPENVFSKLPYILKSGCDVFDNKRERDIFFTGAITVLSGCLQEVSGGYRGKVHYPNLFSFVVAPPASGKGSLTYAKDLGDKYHDSLVAESQLAFKQYQEELREYKKKIANKKEDTSGLEEPDEPPFRVLYIPGNNSSARVIQQLKESEEKGIFLETEADSMGNVLKQDWGGYSDLLRKAFHHEPISYSRKTNKEWVELKRPRLSVALAGTPGQVVNLISSAEDGLFSRFIFYTFKTEIEWIDAGEDFNGVNLTEHFDKLGKEVMQLIEFLTHNVDVKFKLSEEQWVKLNTYGKECLNEIAVFVSEDMSSTVKRLVLIVFRIAMILTTLRYYDNSEINDEYYATDEDVDIAIQVAKVYREHAIFMYKTLPKEGDAVDDAVKRFYNNLPSEFSRKQAIEIAKKENIKTRTADAYLKKLCESNFIEKIKSGYYTKPEKQQ